MTPHHSYNHNCKCNYTTQTTLHYNYNPTTLHYNYNSTTLHYSSCATLHYIQQLWWGDHCNHCNHSKKHNSNHLSVHRRVRSAIRDSQQPISPLGFLFLKLPPPPCAVLLVRYLASAMWSWNQPGILGPLARTCVRQHLNPAGLPEEWDHSQLPYGGRWSYRHKDPDDSQGADGRWETFEREDEESRTSGLGAPYVSIRLYIQSGDLLKAANRMYLIVGSQIQCANNVQTWLASDP